MNSFVMKLFTKRQTGLAQSFAMPMSRVAGAVTLAMAALAFAPAHAQSTNATPVPSDDDAAAQTAADALTAPVSGSEQQDLPNVAMSSQIVFQVLAAEVALQRGQPAPAYQTYL